MKSIPKYDYAVPYRTALNKVLGVLKEPYDTWSELNVFEQQKFFSFLFETNLVYSKIEGYRTPKYTVLKRVCEEIEHTGSVNVEMAGIEPYRFSTRCGYFRCYAETTTQRLRFPHEHAPSMFSSPHMKKRQ
jgi:hypothetical protein